MLKILLLLWFDKRLLSEVYFLAQSYSPANRKIETEPLNLTGGFLGQSYNFRRPVKNFNSELDIRRYHGFTYGDK